MDGLLNFSPLSSNENAWSTRQLRVLYDNVESQIRSLEGLGVSNATYGTLLSSILMNKLPADLRLIISRQLLPWTKGLVRPAFEYASAVWDNCTQQDRLALERAQLSIARSILRCPRRTSHNWEVLKKIDWPTLAWRRRRYKLCCSGTYCMVGVHQTLLNTSQSLSLIAVTSLWETPPQLKRHFAEQATVQAASCLRLLHYLTLSLCLSYLAHLVLCSLPNSTNISHMTSLLLALHN